MPRTLLLVVGFLVISTTPVAANEVKLSGVQPTALVTHDTPPRQQVLLTVDNPGEPVACRLEVRDGESEIAEIDLGPISKGTHELKVLLPEPTEVIDSQWVLLDKAGVTLSSQSLQWKPPRHWTLYVLKSAHIDIGLHDSQYKQRHYTVDFIEKARKLAEETADWPEASRFRYLIEGLWWWFNYPADRGEAATDDIVRDYVKKGIFGVGGSHSGNHTQEFGTEELCRSTYYTQQARDQWGLPVDTMFMIDNNGITWPLVTAYADAGIRYVAFFPNAWRTKVNVGWTSDVPHLFYWQGPDDKSRLLVWSGPHYIGTGRSFGITTGSGNSTPETAAPKMAKHLAKLEERYPYDIWLVSNYVDNETPNLRFPNLAKAWNAQWRWPELRTVSDPSIPFREVEKRFGDQIPTLRGDITGGWAQHPVSTPAYLARKRAADRLLTTAEKLATIARLVDSSFVYPTTAFQRAWDALICSDEHGYGVSPYRGRTVYETWLQKRDWIDRGLETAGCEARRALKTLAAQVPTEGPSVLVFNPLLRLRTDEVEVELPADMESGVEVLRGDNGQPVASQIEGRRLRFVAADVPSFGYATYRLKLGKAGRVAEQSADKPPVVENDFYRVTFAADGSIVGLFDKQLRRELIDSSAPYRCNQFVYTNDDHKTFATPGDAKFTVETSPLGQTVTARMTEPKSGAAIVQTVTLVNHEKRIDIDNRLAHVSDLVPANEQKYLRYGYYAFPFAVPDGVFQAQLNGCLARPHDDQIGVGIEDWLAVQDFVDVANDQFGVTVVQRESHLVEFGEIRTNKHTTNSPPTNSHLYSYLFNDWYQKNWVGPAEVNLRYRYTIRSHQGDCRQGQVAQFARRVAYPMLATTIAKAQSGSLPSPSHSFLQVDAPNVDLLTLKLSEAPGRGVIARLHESEGRDVDKATVAQHLAAKLQATPCTITEQDRGVLDAAALSIDPFDFATIRFTPAPASLAAPESRVANVSDKSVVLGWKPVAGAEQYHVFRGENADFEADAYHLLATTTTPEFTDDWLSSATAYYYRVAAVGPANQQGAVSATVSATTAAQGDSPPAPVGTHWRGLICQPRGWRADRNDTLYLLWAQNREPDLAHYELYRGESPDFAADAATLLAKVEPGPYVIVPYEDKGLKRNTTYFYRVRAVDRDGNKGALSDVWSATTRDVASPAKK